MGRGLRISESVRNGGRWDARWVMERQVSGLCGDGSGRMEDGCLCGRLGLERAGAGGGSERCRGGGE